MKLIEQKVEFLPQEEGLDGIYKQIERCARTCYKSKPGNIESKEFVNKLIGRNHTAMLEHGTVYLLIPREDVNNGEVDLDCFESYSMEVPSPDWAITTNLRVIHEEADDSILKYICKPTEFHHKRYTFKFTCSRAIANELVRHKLLCAA